MTPSRLRVFAVLGVLAAAACCRADDAPPAVQDDAHLFDEPAARQASEQLHDVGKVYGLDFLLRTVEKPPEEVQKQLKEAKDTVQKDKVLRAWGAEERARPAATRFTSSFARTSSRAGSGPTGASSSRSRRRRVPPSSPTPTPGGFTTACGGSRGGATRRRTTPSCCRPWPRCATTWPTTTCRRSRGWKWAACWRDAGPVGRAGTGAAAAASRRAAGAAGAGPVRGPPRRHVRQPPPAIGFTTPFSSPRPDRRPLSSRPRWKRRPRPKAAPAEAAVGPPQPTKAERLDLAARDQQNEEEPTVPGPARF